MKGDIAQGNISSGSFTMNDTQNAQKPLLGSDILDKTINDQYGNLLIVTSGNNLHDLFNDNVKITPAYIHKIQSDSYSSQFVLYDTLFNKLSMTKLPNSVSEFKLGK